jgi:anti-sigma regulatory factor (Ser/Thr protein kinase)
MAFSTEFRKTIEDLGKKTPSLRDFSFSESSIRLDDQVSPEQTSRVVTITIDGDETKLNFSVADLADIKLVVLNIFNTLYQLHPDFFPPAKFLVAITELSIKQMTISDETHNFNLFVSELMILLSKFMSVENPQATAIALHTRIINWILLDADLLDVVRALNKLDEKESDSIVSTIIHNAVEMQLPLVTWAYLINMGQTGRAHKSFVYSYLELVRQVDLLFKYCLDSSEKTPSIKALIALSTKDHLTVYTSTEFPDFKAGVTEIERLKLYLALQELIGNATKYTLADGTQKEVFIEIQEEASRVILLISDQGIGIDPGERESIFQPGFRGAKAQAMVRGGGEGLAKVAQYIHQLGGEIRLLAEAVSPKYATTIRVELPAELFERVE